jgi:hypothetical protein
MSTGIRLALIGLALILLLGGAAWYYLFGPNTVASADLAPANAIVFANIPNAGRLTVDYQTSDLKKLVDSPNFKPVLNYFSNIFGTKNFDLLTAFLPNLSGQSFIAVAAFDPQHPDQIGMVAAAKPKPGLGDFDGFIQKFKAAYPEFAGNTGSGQIDGLDYQWVQLPNAPAKFCVARTRGWIVSAWGEAALQDWWARLQKKAATPNLSQNPDYQKSRDRVGKEAETFLYADGKALQTAFPNRPMASPAPGILAIGSSFEHGQIADHISFLMPHQAQLDAGLPAGPCAFDTLKFTGPDTLFYWGANVNWTQVWKNIQTRNGPAPTVVATLQGWEGTVQNWAQGRSLDLQRNILGPLGDEASVQIEWGSDTLYPEMGLFVKVDKPDDFKPTIAALIDTVRQAYSTTAVVDEINTGDQKFATLKFIQPVPISPTITEDGPYFGVFLTENQAVRSFKRDATVGLLNNADFQRQIGDRWKNAHQIAFLETPQFSDRAYQTALPYLSIAAMFNRTVASMLQGGTPPPDLHWAAPVGTWSWVLSSDDDGLLGYSISGIGNQGILGIAGFQQIQNYLPSLGRFLGPLAPPAPTPPPPAPLPPAPEPPVATVPPPIGPSPATTTDPTPATTNSAPVAPPLSTNAPDATSPTPAPTNGP